MSPQGLTNQSSTSRFSAWVSACGCRNAGELAAAKQQAIEYFVDESCLMMEENLTDYIDSFAVYVTGKDNGKPSRDA